MFDTIFLLIFWVHVVQHRPHYKDYIGLVIVDGDWISRVKARTCLSSTTRLDEVDEDYYDAMHDVMQV